VRAATRLAALEAITNSSGGTVAAWKAIASPILLLGTCLRHDQEAGANPPLPEDHPLWAWAVTVLGLFLESWPEWPATQPGRSLHGLPVRPPVAAPPARPADAVSLQAIADLKAVSPLGFGVSGALWQLWEKAGGRA
jgi:hypothetical protein